MNDLAVQIEALLFAVGRPLSRAELAKHTGADPAAIGDAVKMLAEREGGVTVVDDGKTVELRVAAVASALIEKVRKDEYSRELGKAGQETLAAVLYRGPLTRSEVDFIRGVNSTQILRTLTMRGLVRRVPNPRDERSFLYEPTTELLATLGVVRVEDLPDYHDVRSKLQALEDAYRQKESHETQGH